MLCTFCYYILNSFPKIIPIFQLISWSLTLYKKVLNYITFVKQENKYFTLMFSLEGGCVSPYSLRLKSPAQSSQENWNCLLGETRVTKGPFSYRIMPEQFHVVYPQLQGGIRSFTWLPPSYPPGLEVWGPWGYNLGKVQPDCWVHFLALHFLAAALPTKASISSSVKGG